MTAFIPNVKRFKKTRKGRNYGMDTGHRSLEKYEYGVRCIGRGRIESKHIETARKTITNYFKRNVRVLIRVFPNRSRTQKPVEVRMGRGKGGIVAWYFNIKPMCIFIEFSTTSREEAKNVAEIVGSKMPFRCTLAEREIK